MNEYILIVSNNRQILNNVYKYVNEAYKLLFASTKEELNELLTDQEYEINLVLIDDDCFEESIDQTLNELQLISYLPHYIPLIHKRSPELITKLMIQGAFDCLIKPFSEHDLLLKIESGFRLQNIYEKMKKEVEKTEMKLKEREVFQSLFQEQLMKQRLKADVLDIQDTVDYMALIQDHAKIDAKYVGKKLQERIRDKLLGKTKAKILIIEDEPDYQNYLQALLTPNHTVILSDNAVDGINIASNTPDLDIILLDIRMPYLDGIEAVSLLKNKRPDAHIIMLTASDDSNDIVRALREGAFDYCIKPIIPEELLARVGQSLEEKFYPKVMDEMIKEIHFNHISDARRLALLEELCRKRKAEGKTLHSSEILIFFPDIKQDSLFESKDINPDTVLSMGVDRYIGSVLK